MFIYETRNLYNSNNEGPFKGLVAKSGTSQLPATAGETVLFLGNKADEAIALTQEFVVGSESQSGDLGCFYKMVWEEISPDDWTFTLEKLPKNYVFENPIITQNNIIIGNSLDIAQEIEENVDAPVVDTQDLAISAITSSGYDMEVIIEWSEEYNAGNIRIQYTGEKVEDFYDKEVDGMPATEVTLTCEDSTLVVMCVYDNT